MNKWIILVSLILSSCSPKIVSYINSKAKFNQFESYRLVSAKADSKNLTPENTLVLDLIKSNIHKEMERRSYVISNISPDLTLRYDVASSTRVETDNNTVVGPFYTPPTSRTIYESVLLVEMFDQNKKLVWQGSYDLGQQRKEKKVARAIEKAVGYIFTTYPYRAKSKEVDESLKTLESKK
ncbi:DUF4136 domain-containing protein [Ekhidna sp.]